MKKIFIITLCLFLLLCPWDLLPAQAAAEDSPLHILQNIKFSHVTINDGLPSNNVAAVIQDSQGFLWIGTNDGGLSKFDGIEFKNYINVPDNPESLANNCAWRLYQDKKGNIWVITWGGGVSRYDPIRDVFITYSHDKNVTNSLSSNLIWSVLVDSNDDLWVGTDDGLNKYDPEKKKFLHYRNDPDDPASISNNSVTMILEASDGFLWMSTYGGGLNKFDPEKKTFTRYNHNNNDPRSLGNDSIHNMHRDKDGTLWLCTEEGLDKLDPKTENFTHYRHDKNDTHSLSGAPAASIIRDSKGRLWVATDGHGINLHNPQTDTFQRFQHDPDNPDSLADDVVWDLYEDKHGTIWFTTFNGLDRYDAAESRFKHYQHYPGNPTGLSSNSVQSFAGGREGMVWIGTRGGGLNRFNPVNQSFTHYLHDPENPDSLGNDMIHTIVTARDGVLWIGTGAGVDRFDPHKKTFKHYRPNSNDPGTLSHGAVRDIDIAQDGSLWIGMQGGGLDRFDPVSQKFTHFMPEQDNPNSLVSEWVFAVLVDSFGKIWVGTEGGLSCLDFKKEIFTNFITTENIDFNTRAIYQDQKGMIWIGTNSGLHLFNQESQTFTSYNTDDGLAGDIVASIITDNQGYLWVGTNKGLSKFDTRKKQFRNYDSRDGLQGNQFRQNAAYKNPQGELYFGGVNGFNSFFPEKVIDNPHIPPVILTDFQLFNQSISIGGDSPLQQHINVSEHITLSHDQSVFSIKFAALNYRSSEKNQYAYMMEGFDKDFTYIDSSDPHANYTNLDPGDYTFRVKGSNNDGIWNEQGASIKITILPPWWETAWFRILSLAGLVGFIWAIFQWRLSTVNAHRRVLEHEIIERKQIEEALRESKNQFEGLASNLPGIIYRCSCDDIWTMLYISDFIEEISGYPSSDFTDNRVRTFESIIHPDDSQMAGQAALDAIERKEPYEIEYRIITADGTVRWVYEKGRGIYGDNGQVLWLDGAIFDITDRKQADEERILLSIAIEQADEMIVITDTKATIQYVNPAFQKHTGYSSAEVLGQTTRILKSGEQDKHYYTDMWNTLTDGNTWQGHLINKKKDGSIYHEEASISSVKNASGSIVNYVAVKRDVTKELQKENQLRQSQKMESIGTMAGGIAHDFNNILSAVVGFTQLSLDDVKDRPKTHASLKQVLDAAFRAADLVKQILTFSRSTNIHKTSIKIIPIVKEVCKFMRSTLPTTIEIRQNIQARNDLIMADPTQFHQILMNLCTNAGHAMKETGGELDVLLEEVILHKDELTTYQDLRIGPYLKLSVKDTGSGISKNIFERIFEPYFTTKKQGEGTGLGLAVVHGIVKDYGGDIKIYSAVDKGTTVHVLFPLVEEAASPTYPENDEPLPSGTERIMFVDDEERIASFGKKFLERLGYKVSDFTNAVEALEAFKHSKDNYDLVVTDKTMPKLNGFDLAREIRKVRPDIPVMLCTGYSEKSDEAKAREAGIQEFVIKPLDQRQMARTIRKILDDKP